MSIGGTTFGCTVHLATRHRLVTVTRDWRSESLIMSSDVLTLARQSNFNCQLLPKIVTSEEAHCQGQSEQHTERSSAPYKICQKNCCHSKNDYAGGIVGKVIFSTCYIDLFAVKKKYRNKGIGRELFNTVENYCRINSVKYIYLTTQDYQALEFYLHFGCKVFGELPDVPFKNTTKFF